MESHRFSHVVVCDMELAQTIECGDRNKQIRHNVGGPMACADQTMQIIYGRFVL